MLEFSILFTEDEYIYLVVYENNRKRNLKMTRDEFALWVKNKIEL